MGRLNPKRGRNASISGKYGEDIFESLCSARGLQVLSYRKWVKSTRPIPCCISQYECPHPFRPNDKRAGKNDYMIETSQRRVYVQIKNQNSEGSTCEKLSFAFDIARFALTDESFHEFWLVLLGVWWPQNEGVIEWAQRKCVEFEMLASGTRRKVDAQVIVGPKQLASKMRSLKK